MNRRSIYGPVLIRLFILASCFVGGIRSAPIDSDDEVPVETKLQGNASDDSRALSIPFLPSKDEAGKDKPSGLGLPGLSGLSGLPDISSGAQVFFGAILPLPKLTDMLQMFGTLGNIAGNMPSLPNLLNPGSS